MNLPLHYGLLGALEAGLIALLVALLVYAGWAWLARRNGMSQGHVVGWSCLVATVIGAGYDIWNLVYICIVRLESPLYARLAFASIHDPDGLGTRVVLELAGVLAGVGLGWRLFSAESEKNDAEAV